MSKFEKLLERIKNNPKTVRFDELDKILLGAGWQRFQPSGGSSHNTYRKQGENPLTIPKHGGFVKEVYVKEVIARLRL